MIKIENTDVFGWEAAIRGMRNPMNSWNKSDTRTVDVPQMPRLDYYGNVVEIIPAHEEVIVSGKKEEWTGVGENDLKLMKSLSKAGNDHGKFLRMINVTCDITAPFYWWKEFDTYKVGTVANSCSTMHKIAAKEFTLDDFSCEHLIDDGSDCSIYPYAADAYYGPWNPTDILATVVNILNEARRLFIETKDKKYWWQMIQLLPSSYNQKRTVQLNYQVLKSIYFARQHHKLDEWREFCSWIETLPYFKEIVLED